MAPANRTQQVCSHYTHAQRPPWSRNLKGLDCPSGVRRPLSARRPEWAAEPEIRRPDSVALVRIKHSVEVHPQYV